MIRSLCRGVARGPPAPKRSRSKVAAYTAITSMAQHAMPKVIGQMLLPRPQPMRPSTALTGATSGRVLFRRPTASALHSPLLLEALDPLEVALDPHVHQAQAQ